MLNGIVPPSRRGNWAQLPKVEAVRRATTLACRMDKFYILDNLGHKVKISLNFHALHRAVEDAG
jgi:hypothetical protein